MLVVWKPGCIGIYGDSPDDVAPSVRLSPLYSNPQHTAGLLQGLYVQQLQVLERVADNRGCCVKLHRGCLSDRLTTGSRARGTPLPLQ